MGEPPRPSLDLPRVIGHRGAAALAPENTLAALRRAADLGVRMVEVDVKLTADGVPILMHDDMLDRTTDGAGPVRDASAADIARLDAGSWFGDAFAGEPVPTLGEALALAASRDLSINLEIKPCPGRAAETAAVALAEAGARWPADRPPPLISSFDGDALAAARRAAPDWPMAMLFGEPPEDWQAQADAVGAATIHVEAARTGDAVLAELTAAERPVLAYTVNDPTRARALWQAGVAAVFTDVPDLLLAASQAPR